MKKLSIRLLLVLMALLLCSTQALAAEYVLSLNLSIAPVHNRWTMAIKPWADEINKRSEGRIQIEPYFAQAISKQAEVVESVRTGIADLGEATFTGGGLGRFPFHEQIINLTSPANCTVDAAALVQDLHKAFPQEAMRDVEGTKLLFLEGHSMGMIIGTRDKPVRTLDDLKGLKIGVPGGGIRVERVKALGATVVGVTMPDMYMSLEKGIIDGAVIDGDTLISRKLGDVIKHVTLINIGGSVFYCVMNPDSFDRLPADLQKVVEDVSRDFAPPVFKQFWESMQFNGLQKWITEQKGNLYMLDPADYARAETMVAETYDGWIKFSKSKGLPAEAILQKYRELEKIYMTPWADSKAASLVAK
ncbi:TRAP transporter substrate-binding protein [Desulfovibrio sp. OttesenSCG-928-C06]|nr:TRAP transporter substrate-binding protein [Desulfovibrio sp. OttesenSCG-928-C06]